MFNSLSATKSCSIKETNWLINKGICVLLFDPFKHLLLRKIVVLKTCWKSNFFRKKIWRTALALKSKKVQGVLRKTFILALLSSAVFRLKNHLKFLQNCFVREIKGFCQFLQKSAWFCEHNECFPKYLG